MLCRIYEWEIEKELDDTGSVQSTRLTHHLEQCPHCRTYHRRLIQLREQLSPNMSCQLNEMELQQIHASVQQALSDKSLQQSTLTGMPSHKSIPMPVGIRLIAAVLVISAIAGLWVIVNRPRLSEPVPQLSFDSQKVQTQAAFLLQAPERSIQGEIQNLGIDAKYAFNFIQNCTPAPPQPQAQNSTEQN